MEQPVGQGARGWELCPPVPHTQPGVCSHPPPPGPSLGPGKTLSQWENVLSLSLSDTADSDKAPGPPQGLAGLPPASQEAGARQAAGQEIGSAPQQLTLRPGLCPSLHTWLPVSTPALGPRPTFPARLLTRSPFHSLVPLS